MESLFKQKRVTGLFAIVAVIGGIFFTRMELTGNVILNRNVQLNPLPIIGILLLLCSAVLAAYTLKKG
jgi:drug/metabolite transporter (DMT)-like permease